MTERLKRYRSADIYPINAEAAISEITTLANKWGVKLSEIHVSGSEDGELYISTYNSLETDEEMDLRVRLQNERIEQDKKRELEMYKLLKKKYGDDGSS